SSNVEDRRGMSGGMIGGGIGGVGLIIYLIFTLLGGDPSILTGNTPNQQNNTYTGTTEEQEVADFVSVVLADTEVVWNEVFNEYGMDYEEPTLVLFTNSVQSACGVAGSSTGP